MNNREQIFEASPEQIKVINKCEDGNAQHTKDKKLCHLFQQAALKHISVSMNHSMKQKIIVNTILNSKIIDNIMILNYYLILA